MDKLPIGITAQCDDLYLGTPTANLAGDLFAVHLRHRDVEHENVGAQFLDARQAFFAIGGLSHQLELRRAADQMSNGLSNERMIVGEHDADGFHRPCMGTWMIAVVPRFCALSIRSVPPMYVIRSRMVASPRP